MFTRFKALVENGAFDPFNIVDGHSPQVRTVEQRRRLDPEEVSAKVFPEHAHLEEEFAARGGRKEDAYFTSSRGLKLFSRTLIPKDPRGGVLVCHGYSSHLRFQNKKTMLEYALRGYVVTGIEYEGHGWSDGILMYLESSKAMMDDVQEFFLQQQAEYDELEWLVHGESLGGNVALNMCLRGNVRGKRPKGVMLIAPMCKIADEVMPSDAAIGTLSFLSKLMPTLSITPSSINGSIIFKDKHAMEAIHADPLLYQGRPRLSTARELHYATLRLEEQLHELETPFFVIHGTEDVVTTHKASEALYEKSVKVKAEDKEMMIVEGAWHGLMWAEDEKDEYWEKILGWALNRL